MNVHGTFFNVVICVQCVGQPPTAKSGHLVGVLIKPSLMRKSRNVCRSLCYLPPSDYLTQRILTNMDIDINALGQSLDTSWGRSSTPKTAGYSVKFTMQGSRVIASLTAIINFGSEKEMILTKRAYSAESVSIIDNAVKQVRDTYKEITDESIKFDEVGSTESVEVIGFNVHNPKRTAYFRRKSIFEVS